MKGLAGVFGDRPNACSVETYKLCVTERLKKKVFAQSRIYTLLQQSLRGVQY